MEENSEAENGSETGSTPMTKAQANIIISLLSALLVVALFGALGGCSVTAPSWEYKVGSVEDNELGTTMARLGAQGWEIASARRAVSGEGSASRGIYEFIFKRPHSAFRASYEERAR